MVPSLDGSAPGPEPGASHVAQVTLGNGNTIIGTARLELHAPVADLSEDDRRELQLLRERVRQFWIDGILSQSLHGEAMVALGKRWAPDVIDHPWRMVLDLRTSSAPLEEGAGIGAVYRDHGRALLILGEPGGGKTTTLLDLARILVEASENDPSEPVPVLLNLSTWGAKRQPLLAWAAAELNDKYYVPLAPARRWLQQRRLVLLLDGLDELASQHRTACVAEINRFLRRVHAPGIAVCSRTDDYLELPVRLAFPAAIRLEPLTGAQIDAYLERGGQRLSGLRAALDLDPALRELASSPLLLDVMALSYRDLGSNRLRQAPGAKADETRTHLLTAYVARMTRHRGERDGDPGDDVLLGFLRTLAGDMARHSQPLSLIERLQPSYLQRTGRILYIAVSRLLIGILLAVALGVSSFLSMVFGMSVLAAALGGWPDGWGKPAHFGGYAKSMIGSVVLQGLALTLLAIAVDGLRSRKNSPAGAGLRLRRSLLLLVMYCLPSATYYWIVITKLGGGLPLAGVVAFTLLNALQIGVPFGIVLGTRHLRPLDEEICTAEALRWSLRSTPVGTVAGAVCGGLIGGLIPAVAIHGFGFPVDADAAPRIAAVGALVAGGIGFVLGGIQPRVAGMSRRPNAPIRRSFRTSFLVGLAAMAASLCTVSALTGMNVLSGIFVRTTVEGGTRVLNIGVENGEGLLLILAVGVGCLLGSVLALRLGGADAIAHYTLRVLLRFLRGYPMRLVPLLDCATDRLFLRRAGGGYMFTHRLLLDFFANGPPVAPGIPGEGQLAMGRGHASEAVQTSEATRPPGPAAGRGR